jgi:hypothetical protein
MKKLSDLKIDLIRNATSPDDYWYITKQECNFRNLCYIADILYKWNDDTTINYEDFFNSLKETSPYSEFIGKTAHRATKNLEKFGLAKFCNGYESSGLCSIFNTIKERCNGDFSKTELYQDIIDKLIEKITLITSKIHIHPAMFTFKVLLTIGDCSGDYSISFQEFKLFVATAHQWNDYFQCVDSILRFRTDSDYKVECLNAAKDSNISDTRYNIVLKNHSLLETSDNKISISEKNLKSVRKIVAEYESGDEDLQNLDISKIKVARLNDQPLQIIFYGAPGTGKSFTIDRNADPERSIRTTFHPDSDYASFVGAYKPTMERMPIVAFNGTQVTNAVGIGGHDGKESKIVYKYVPQAFLKAYVEAWKDLTKPYYLIIEEINRGNCAQIFGDLFQLLDRNNTGCSSYAIAADEDITQFLSTDDKGFAKLPEDTKESIRSFILVKDNGDEIKIGEDILNGNKLLLPPNLYIWATMNTSDQSLFPIDSAFKRRWNWEYMPIAYDKESWTFTIGKNKYSWGGFLQKINPIISRLTESPDKQMGFYFAKPDKRSSENVDKNDTISENVFLNKVLFYLWTDVLKDFDAGEEPFLNADTSRAYAFSEFFDKSKNYLQQFVDKLELRNLAESDDAISSEDSDDNDSMATTDAKYVLDGNPYKGIGEVIKKVISVLSTNLSFDEIEQSFKNYIQKTLNGLLGIQRASEPRLNDPNQLYRWYADDYTSTDGIKFRLIKEWHDNDFSKIKSLVDNYSNYFPNGLVKNETSN